MPNVLGKFASFIGINENYFISQKCVGRRVIHFLTILKNENYLHFLKK